LCGLKLPDSCYCNSSVLVCIATWVLNKMSMMTILCDVCVSGEGSRTGGIHIIGASRFFLNRGSVRSTSGPVKNTPECIIFRAKLKKISHPKAIPLVASGCPIAYYQLSAHILLTTLSTAIQSALMWLLGCRQCFPLYATFLISETR